ncbi:hypothetical protein PpBr36_06872 [Pyricularia pennisetigena]|uniref:hypothetical protein n=1 Tax=Pyricularia pennisetigena TaxID=1578925 RepID=UPI001150BFBD|nr:hypothetical protein PpBr36_06872 [Pyricularia pennisetigena]TLS25519.1 hypothetical protein PpBr36_06872 [Pyricularia pennisetigena]
MKVAKACSECRLKKRKCTVEDGASDRPGACCPCSKRGLSASCTLAVVPSTGAKPLLPASPTPPPAVPAQRVGPPAISKDQTVDMVHIYLDLIHDKPHTLFHPATLLRDVHDGVVPDQVLYSILAMAAPFLVTDQASTAIRPADLLEVARDALKADLETMSLDNVRAAVLIGNLCGALGYPDAEILYFGIALRIAQIIRLPAPAPTDSVIEQEVKLRVWWSLYMIDRWSSAGTDIRRQLADDDKHPLPMDELQFHRLEPSAQLPPVPSRAGWSESDFQRPGLWGRMVQLAGVFAAIQDSHRRHVEGMVDNARMEDDTQRIGDYLDSWARDLPPELACTPENVERQARLGLGSAFVALHLGFFHYSTLLYFPFLDLQLRETDRELRFASRCRYYAAAFSDLLSLAHACKGCDAVYLVVAHMTVVSSAALLHMLLFGSDTEIPSARRRLEANFEILVKLRAYWPAVGLMMERLFTFQRACMSSANPNTHQVDRWMGKFLLQHALPIPDKTGLPPEGTNDYTLLSERDKLAHDALSILRP